MPLALFRWAFHSYLLLPENRGFYVNTRGRVGTIRCVTRDGVGMFSYAGGDYSWLTKPAESYRLALAERAADKETVFREVHYLDKMDSFSGGVTEPVKYAVVEIATEIEDMTYLQEEDKLDGLKNWAAVCLGDFVDWYRLVTNEPDVPTPRIEESPIVEIWVADDYTLSRGTLEASLRFHGRTINWTSPAATGHIKASPSMAVVRTLEEVMERGEAPPLYERLLLEAKELAHLTRKFELSLVVAETAFEVLVQRELAMACERKGIDHLPLGSGKNEKEVDYSQAIEGGRLRDDLLGRYPEILAGVNLRQSGEYRRWYQRAYTPRNAIVHEGERSTSENEAQEAFEAIVALGELVREMLS